MIMAAKTQLCGVYNHRGMLIWLSFETGASDKMKEPPTLLHHGVCLMGRQSLNP